MPLTKIDPTSDADTIDAISETIWSDFSEEQICKTSTGEGSEEEADIKGPKSDEGVFGEGIKRVENE